MKAFEFFEHTADIGVHVYGATLADLFQNAAAALYDALGKFRVGGTDRRRTIRLESMSLEDLLHDWLAELLYDLETEQILYGSLNVLEVGPGLLLAELKGGAVDFEQSQTNEEIKAVTYHQLCVEQLADRSWRATVIFDV